MVAVVHRGERIVPAAQNRGAVGGAKITVQQTFVLAGPVTDETQQLAASAAHGILDTHRRRADMAFLQTPN